MFEDSVAAIPSLWSSMNSWLSPTVLFVLLNVMIGIIAFTSTLANQSKHTISQQEHSQNHSNHYHNHHQQLQPNRLARSPSLLERVRSINFYSYRSQEPNLVTAPASTNLNLENTQKHETSSHYIFNQLHQENEPHATNVQFNYLQQNDQESSPQVNNQYVFEHAQDDKAPENDVSSSNINEHLEEEAVFEEEDGDEPQSLDEVYSKLKGHHFSRTKSDTEPSSGEAQPKLPTKMRKSASMKSPFGHFEADDILEKRRPATVKERGAAKVTEMEHGVDAKADDFINKFKEQLKLQRIDSIIRYKEMITRGSGK
ncbi:hypothetical protein Leryth_004967 [Lithospermum erythrorhizon]|nr:hypothetical protein Leryth_004967 [Lithospermum erythrorhizon]